MKSVEIKKYGGSEAVEINQSASEPIVSPGKVLVIVKSRGNPSIGKFVKVTCRK